MDYMLYAKLNKSINNNIIQYQLKCLTINLDFKTLYIPNRVFIRQYDLCALIVQAFKTRG